jgi:hypothetical protein
MLACNAAHRTSNLRLKTPSITPLHPRLDQFCIPIDHGPQLEDKNLCLAISWWGLGTWRIDVESVIDRLQQIKSRKQWHRNLIRAMAGQVGPEDGGIGPERRKRWAPDGSCGARHGSQDVSEGEANCANMEIIDRRDAEQTYTRSRVAGWGRSQPKGACFNQRAASQRHAVFVPWTLA